MTLASQAREGEEVSVMTTTAAEAAEARAAVAAARRDDSDRMVQVDGSRQRSLSRRHQKKVS